MLKDLSRTLSFFFIKHNLNEEKQRIYLTMPSFTAYIEPIELQDSSVFWVRVYRPYDEADPTQTDQDKNVCRAQKYMILKKLWLLNSRVNNQFPFEPLPDGMTNTMLFPNERIFKPIIITEFN